MLEAHRFEHRPLVYTILRRIELLNWTWGIWRGKCLHPKRPRFANARMLWLALTCYETERCDVCGWKVEVVWWCDNPGLWEKLTNYEGGGGVTCVKCFDRLAEAQGILIQWRPIVLKGGDACAM